MSFSDLLIHRANLQVESESTSAKGVITATWSTILPNFRCRIQPLSSQEAGQLRKAGIETTHRLYCQTRIAATAGFTNMVMLILGSQSTQRKRHRVVHSVDSIQRFYEITGVYDTDLRETVCVIDLVHRPDSYING